MDTSTATDFETPLGPEELARFKDISKKLFELDRWANEMVGDPSAKISVFDAHTQSQLALLREHHEQEMQEMKARHEREINNHQSVRVQERVRLIAQLSGYVAEHRHRREPFLSQMIKPSFRATFEEMVSTFLESDRPTLIPVPGYDMFLLQLASAPTCAFIVNATYGGRTRWGVRISNSYVWKEHKLVCFCRWWCMSKAKRQEITNQISVLSKKYGIEHVFGQKVRGVYQGVSFHDGGSFDLMMQHLGVFPRETYVKETYVSICE
jgi:uncharacterized protein YeaO (DUF488 family)